MGTIDLDKENKLAVLNAHVILYGNAASAIVAAEVAKDINTHWNFPGATVKINEAVYKFRMNVTAEYNPGLQPEEIFQNDDPHLNYFRIETFASGNISYVDDLSCNTGYFLLANIVDGSTTAAHEFGHTLGLAHPHIIDIRGQGTPGIMYPRGTITDPHFQYDASVPPGTVGGTLNPAHRQVLQSDIDDLHIPELGFDENGHAIIGAFSSVWHEAHRDPKFNA